MTKKMDSGLIAMGILFALALVFLLLSIGIGEMDKFGSLTPVPVSGPGSVLAG